MTDDKDTEQLTIAVRAGDADKELLGLKDEALVKRLSNGHWQVRSLLWEDYPMWIATGRCKTEAIGEFVMARLGYGFSWNGAGLVVRGDLTIEDYRDRLGLTDNEVKTMIESHIRYLRAEG